MNTHSDKHGLPPRTIHRLGQESMALLGRCMWHQADFPADAFLSRGTGTTRAKPGIKRNTAAHEG